MQCPFVEIGEELYFTPRAEFGPGIPQGKIEGKVVMADPLTADIPLLNADNVLGHLLLVERGECDFVTKVVHAQLAGAIAVLVANTDISEPTAAFMMTAGRRQQDASLVKIPSVMLSYETSELLKSTLAKAEKTNIPITVSLIALDPAAAGKVLEKQSEDTAFKKQQQVEKQLQQDREKQKREAARLLRDRLVTTKSPMSPAATPVLEVQLSSNTDPVESFTLPAPSDLSTALLIMDLQYYFAMPKIGQHLTTDVEDKPYYFERIKQVVVPNIQDLQRNASIEIIYSVVESATLNGRERSSAHKAAGFHVPKGSFEGKVLDSISPRENEIVIPRTAISVFGTTGLDFVLRNLGIRHLVVAGVSTLGSLSAAVRDASDRGYVVSVIADGIVFENQNMHHQFLQEVSQYGVHVISTADCSIMLK